MDFRFLYEHILNVYTDLGIVTFPINCLEIARRCGLALVGYSTLNKKKREACRRLSQDACLIDGTLYYEENAHRGRINFSIAHELGHLFLHTSDEDEADEFASHFLAPRILIHKYGFRSADQIHDAFGLSYKASNRALQNYRKWFNNIARTTRRPSAAERQLELLISKEDLESIDYEEEEENYTPTPEEKYLYIQRALKARLPIPPEYASFYQMYRKMRLN